MTEKMLMSFVNAPKAAQAGGVFDPRKTLITGDALKKPLKTGLTYTVEIQLCDTQGLPTPQGGSQISLKATSIEHKGQTSAKVVDKKDHGNGKYSLTFEPFIPGRTSLDFHANSQTIGQSPYIVEVTAGKPTFLSDHEQRILAALNHARTDPKGYAKNVLEPLRSCYSGNNFKAPGCHFVTETKEGAKALENTIADLKILPAVGSLTLDRGLSRVVYDLCESKAAGTTSLPTTERLNRYGSSVETVVELSSYGDLTPELFVAHWIIDDGVDLKTNRNTLFDRRFSLVGLSCSSHPQLVRMAVAIFAADFTPHPLQPTPSPRASPRPELISPRSLAAALPQEPDEEESVKQEPGKVIIVTKPLRVPVNQLILTKEGNEIHVEKIQFQPDGERISSNYRWEMPWDFRAVDVGATINPTKSTRMTIVVLKAKVEVTGDEKEISNFTLPPNPASEKEKPAISVSESPSAIFYTFTACKFDVSVKVTVQGPKLRLIQEVIQIFTEGTSKYKQKTTHTSSMSLPFTPVEHADQWVLSPGSDGLTYTVQVTKPEMLGVKPTEPGPTSIDFIPIKVFN